MHRDIDISLLRAFLAVVETGSVTKAAGTLNLTQAAVSQQIKRLEELFDTSLFSRANRRLNPTASGERLVAHARRLIALNDEIWTLMRAPEFEGEVRLGRTTSSRPICQLFCGASTGLGRGSASRSSVADRSSCSTSSTRVRST